MIVGYCKRRWTTRWALPAEAEENRATRRIELRSLHHNNYDGPVRQHGVPIRTIQHYLGHKNLETTMIYLGIKNNDELRGNINRAMYCGGLPRCSSASWERVEPAK